MTRSPARGAEGADRHFAANLQELQETQVSLLIMECVLALDSLQFGNDGLPVAGRKLPATRSAPKTKSNR
jgi:hypothetical protein